METQQLKALLERVHALELQNVDLRQRVEQLEAQLADELTSEQLKELLESELHRQLPDLHQPDHPNLRV